MHKGIRDSRYLVQYTYEIHKLENCIEDALKNTTAMVVIKNSKKLAKLSLKTQQLKFPCDYCIIPFKKLVNPPNTRWSGYLKNLQGVQ